jgi:hypothetical protein
MNNILNVVIKVAMVIGFLYVVGLLQDQYIR